MWANVNKVSTADVAVDPETQMTGAANMSCCVDCYHLIYVHI